MGSCYEFTCKTCNMAAEVSGGDDCGEVVATRTMYCKTCAALCDVTVGYAGESDSFRPAGRGADEIRFGKCRACGGENLAPWANGDPCPKCGGHVERGMLTMNWD